MKLQDKIKQLAELAVKIGVNVLPGDTVEVNVPVERADLARELASEAYKAGAHKVIITWYDDFKNLLDYTYSPTEVMSEVHQFEFDKNETLLKSGVKQIFVKSTDPELLKSIDPEKIQSVTQARSEKLHSLMKYRMNDITSWTIISAPSEGWAKKVFPDSEDPVADLWEAIFETTRVNKEDPVKSWNDNINLLVEKAKWMNEQNFSHLHYTNSKGTDLTIGLQEGHIWRAASTQNIKGEAFVPNMPTEEVYTLADKYDVNGRVYSAKPLANAGNVIDDFWLEFKDGKVVDFDAKVGKEALKSLLDRDGDNSKRLGEVALVPHDSPISNSNILFFNTLFDENASCHLAVGAAYPTTIERGENMSEEELEEHHVNQSKVHADFMVGTKDLDIVGIKRDGSKVQVFKDGNWA